MILKLYHIHLIVIPDTWHFFSMPHEILQTTDCLLLYLKNDIISKCAHVHLSLIK